MLITWLNLLPTQVFCKSLADTRFRNSLQHYQQIISHMSDNDGIRNTADEHLTARNLPSDMTSGLIKTHLSATRP